MLVKVRCRVSINVRVMDRQMGAYYCCCYYYYWLKDKVVIATFYMLTCRLKCRFSSKLDYDKSNAEYVSV